MTTATKSQIPNFSLTGQIALVTGAGRGLGRAIAIALAAAGADVALGLRDANTSRELVAEIEALGRHAFPVQMDVTKLDQINRATEKTVERFGKLDILVNNAGGGFTNLAIDVPEEEFDATLNINLKATFFAAQAAAKIMMRQGGGRIINMSSQAGYAALPTESVYCASKAAVSHLTKCL
ncbi:MAG TPA: SDR family NAD(P)-dependent oxidoreductase, partial [Candidatus Acidoferrum sp.]|nr:SDR family NAD(P)-dependent oxidoreductase [Candidatus Acidoferrum sp.]